MTNGQLLQRHDDVGPRQFYSKGPKDQGDLQTRESGRKGQKVTFRYELVFEQATLCKIVYEISCLTIQTEDKNEPHAADPYMYDNLIIIHMAVVLYKCCKVSYNSTFILNFYLLD